MQDKSHYTRYNYKKLYELAVEMFIRYGFSREDSEKVADVILTSDRFGVESHGVNRLTLYPFGIDIGRIKVDAKPEVVEDRLSMSSTRTTAWASLPVSRACSSPSTKPKSTASAWSVSVTPTISVLPVTIP